MVVCFSPAGRTYVARVENLSELVEEDRARGTRHSVQDLTDMFVHVNTMMNIIAMISIELRGRRKVGMLVDRIGIELRGRRKVGMLIELSSRRVSLQL